MLTSVQVHVPTGHKAARLAASCAALAAALERPRLGARQRCQKREVA